MNWRMEIWGISGTFPATLRIGSGQDGGMEVPEVQIPPIHHPESSRLQRKEIGALAPGEVFNNYLGRIPAGQFLTLALLT
jgi:hypothetical protein